jgi:lipopolysaccharide transport system permease protein
VTTDLSLELTAGTPGQDADERGFTTIIRPAQGWAPLNLGALWRYRELLYFLAWRDVKVRYKQTALGASWAVLQPVLTMVVFTVIFGHVARIPSDGVPYPIFSYCGLLPWTFFASAIGQASTSLVGNAHLISKVYFPRLVIPIAALLAGLPDFAIAFVVLLGMMLFYGVVPTPAVITLPLFLLLVLATALAVGIWLSALSVQYRDVRYVVPFLTQLWLYASPVAYPAGLIRGQAHLLYALNPMAGVVEGFRWAILGKGGCDGLSLALSGSVTLVVLISGLFYFRRLEQQVADVV